MPGQRVHSTCGFSCPRKTAGPKEREDVCKEGVFVLTDSLNKLWMREILKAQISIGKVTTTAARCQDGSAAFQCFFKDDNALIFAKSLSSSDGSAESCCAASENSYINVDWRQKCLSLLDALPFVLCKHQLLGLTGQEHSAWRQGQDLEEARY